MIATQTRSKMPFRKSKGCFVFAVATVVCWILMISNAFVSGADVATNSFTVDTTSSKKSKTGFGPPVIELTSKSFGSTVGFGDQVWLIEFYTPTCSHCVNFAATYENIARTLHAEDSNIRVARVNCQEEKALMTRFGIKAFPSFFLVTGLEVYEFEGNRSAATLTKFARGGYKKTIPIPFMNSPMGPMGLLQGTLIFLGTRAMGMLEYLNENYGISPIFSAVIISMGGVFCGMISIILLTVLSTPKGSEKND